MSENIVTIKGNQYKYTYVDGETKYLGPVGSAPALTEQEFLKAMSRTMPDTDKKYLKNLLNGEFSGRYEAGMEPVAYVLKKGVSRKLNRQFKPIFELFDFDGGFYHDPDGKRDC